jgi:hypothetical protein
MFWTVMCGLVSRYQRFGGRHFLHLKVKDTDSKFVRNAGMSASRNAEHVDENLKSVCPVPEQRLETNKSTEILC